MIRLPMHVINKVFECRAKAAQAAAKLGWNVVTALEARETAVFKSPNHISGKAAVWFPPLSPFCLRLLRNGARLCP